MQHAWVQCNVPPGVGRSHRWTVTVGGQASTPSNVTTSYALPALSAISGSNFNTEGGQSVVLTGVEFGPETSTPLGRLNEGLLLVYYGPLVWTLLLVVLVVFLSLTDVTAVAGTGCMVCVCG